MNDSKILEIYKNGKKVDEWKYWVCKKCELLRTNRHTHNHGEPLRQEVIDDIKKWEVENEKRNSQAVGASSENGIS